MMLRGLIAAAAVFAIAGSASAAGGGGGGGGSVPSSSGPSYDPVVEYQAGVDNFLAGDFEKAERAFKRVVEVAKTDANSQFMLGMAHSEQDEWKPAAKALKSAVRYNPEFHEARARLGIAYLKLDDGAKADEQLAELNAAKAACAGACPASANIDAAIEMLSGAKAAPEAAVGDVSGLFGGLNLAAADSVYLGAVRQINLGDYDGAKAELGSVLTAIGPHPDVLTYLGFANRKQGNYQIAVAYYNAALAVDPAHLNAREYLGEYFVELGDLVAAKAQLAQIDELCPFGCAQGIELQQWIDKAGS